MTSKKHEFLFQMIKMFEIDWVMVAQFGKHIKPIELYTVNGCIVLCIMWCVNTA